MQLVPLSIAVRFRTLLREEMATTVSMALHRLMHFMAKTVTIISMDLKVMTGYVVAREMILYAASLVWTILKEAKAMIRSTAEMGLTPFSGMIQLRCCLEMIKYMEGQVQTPYMEDLETIRSMEAKMMTCSMVELART